MIVATLSDSRFRPFYTQKRRQRKLLPAADDANRIQS
jgi:hypothetical protein